MNDNEPKNERKRGGKTVGLTLRWDVLGEIEASLEAQRRREPELRLTTLITRLWTWAVPVFRSVEFDYSRLQEMTGQSDPAELFRNSTIPASDRRVINLLHWLREHGREDLLAKIEHTLQPYELLREQHEREAAEISEPEQQQKTAGDERRRRR